MSMGGGANLGTATFYITGNAQGASNAAVQANNALAQLTNTVNNQWWGLQNLGLAFAAFPAAVSAGVGYAVKASIEWQDAMFGVERATGAAGEELNAIEEDLLAVARQVPLATSELAELAAGAAQLGVGERDIASFAATFGTLISATNLTSANMGDFARVLNVLNVPQEQWENFANNLLEVGRNTAATESEILNMSRRLAATGAQANMTSSDILGISAAVLSLGPRAEAGATALQKTVFDMIRAISAGGDELEIFANTAGMSGDEFRRAFGEDSAQTLARFITGLGQMGGNGSQAIATLDALGITEARQAQALTALAAGTRNVGSEQTDLNTILAKSTEYGSTNATLLAVQEARSKTLSGQIQILKNHLFELGQSIGSVVIGPLGFMIQRFLDFAVGLQSLPMPLKLLLGALIALVTAITSLGAVVFLVGPRLLIAYQALQSLRQGAMVANGPVTTLGASMLGTANAARVMGSAVQTSAAQVASSAGAMNAAAVQTNSAAGVMNLYAGSTAAAGASSAGAVAGVSRLAGWASRLGKIAGWAGLAITALSVGTMILGGRQRKAAEDAEKALEANDDLVSIMKQQGAQVGPASMEWIKASERYQIAAAMADRLGFSLETLDRIITGQATPKEEDDFTQALKKGGEAGEEMGRKVLELGRIFANSAGKAGVAATAIDNTAASEEMLAMETQEANEKLREQAEELEGIAQAHIDLADARRSVLDATASLKDAQEAYTKAMADAKNPAEMLARAELELLQARHNLASAQRDLLEKEEDLAEARAKGAENLRDAELDLADAHDRYLDSLETIRDLEAEIAEVRAGPSADDLRDATNDLRNAELRLARAHQTVADAEWYLQHLREEGASDRDIKDAEFALAEARQGTADAEDELIDATEALNDLRDINKQQEKLAELERDLQSAYRDSERAAREIQDREEALSDARARVANDTDYKEAQADLVDAQLAVKDALLATKDAELELAAVRKGRAQEDAQSAALELEAALIRMATAQAEVRQQMALAAGETWDAGDSAHALGEELSKLIGLAPDNASRNRLQSYIDTLMAAPNVPDAPKGGGSDFEFDPTRYGLPPLDAVQSYMDQLDEILEGKKKDKKKGGIWQQIFDGLGGGAGIGGLAGGTIGMFVGGPVGAIVGGIIGSIVGGLVERFWPAITGFFRGIDWGGLAGDARGWGMSIMEGLWGGITGGLSWFFSGIGNWLHRTFVQPFKDFFGIRSPSTLFAQFGKDIIQGLINGLYATIGGVFNFFGGLGGRIIGAVGDGSRWLINTGIDILNGLLGGIDIAWDAVWDFFSGMGGRIMDSVRGASKWLVSTGRNIIIGLANGIASLVRHIPFIGDNIANTLINGINSALGVSSPSKVMYQIGQYVIMGLEQGLLDEQSRLERAIAETAGLMEDGLAKDYVASFLADPSVGRAAFAASAAGLSSGQGGGNTYQEILNLEAITTADPTEIVNEYVWAKRIRVRGK